MTPNNTAELEPCPDCGALLPPVEGYVHRYVGASAACWAIYSALNNAGDPPLAPDPAVAFLTDAYMANHPGRPNPQAIQSVAVHVLTLCGYLERGQPASSAVWLRRQAVGDDRDRHQRYHWLIPPSFAGCLTVADIAAVPGDSAASARQRTDLLRQYINQIWQVWSAAHGPTIAGWYDRYVAGR